MESTLRTVTRDILASYAAVGGLNNTDGLNLPSKGAVDTICSGLLQVLFPGFHDDEAVLGEFLPDLTFHRITTISDSLEDQICRSLRIGDPACPEARARNLLSNFLKSLPAIRELLQTDIQAAYEGDPAAISNEEIILSYPCVETIAIQRCAHKLYEAGIPIIPRMMTEWAHSRTGIDVHPGARIGTHFFIDHGTGVVIGETCVIGNHVKLYHGVTLGARSFQKDEDGHLVKGGKRHPNVEDWVTIYPNSTVLGGETVIGRESTIGANVFLMHSVPARSLVTYEETQLRVIQKRQTQSIGLEWHI